MTTTPQICQSPAPSTPPSKRHRRPRLSPTSLLDHLQQNPAATLNTLTAHFHCSLDKLSQLLNNPEFLTRHKLQTQLAFLQSRLAAHDSLPGALAKTITLMNEAEKPEVARRAAAALIQIAGLPIRTATQPAPAPLPEPPPPPEPPTPVQMPLSDEVTDILRALATAPEVRYIHGIDLAQTFANHRDEFFHHLRKFFEEFA